MSGKCENCNCTYHQFMARSTPIGDRIYQTKRYYRCPKCNTVYVEVLKPQHLDKPSVNEIIRVEKHPPKKEATLDNWMKKE